jgi:hypothetical protein
VVRKDGRQRAGSRQPDDVEHRKDQQHLLGREEREWWGSGCEAGRRGVGSRPDAAMLTSVPAM